MAIDRQELVWRGFGRLMRGGSASGLGAGELLERFASERDPAAFEALVGRHGPMVLGTCRRMLADPHDVDDAFQATFLVLARKAGSIRDADRLGPWLHGVARRVAARSRASSSRRRSLERTGGDEPTAEVSDPLEGSEVRAAIDEELARLPEKYRAPLVLCYLEGLTHDEAAEHLRWPVGTVRSRLAGGRDRLRARLTRRGLAPSAVMPGLLSKGILSPALLSRTIRVATSAGSAPAHVATLAKGALIAMTWNKLKTVAALGLMAGLTAGGAGVAAQYGGMGKAEAKADAAQVGNPRSAPGRGVLAIGKLRHEDDQLDAMIREVKAIEDAIPAAASRLEDLKRNRNRGLDAIAALKKKLGIDQPAEAPALAPRLTRDQLDAGMTKLRSEQAKVEAKIKELESEHDDALGRLRKAAADLAAQEFELTQRWKTQHQEATEADVDDRIKRLEKQITDQSAVIRNLQGRGDGPSVAPTGPDPTPSAKPAAAEAKKTANNPRPKPVSPSVIPMSNGDYVLVIAGESNRVIALNTRTGARSALRLSPGVTEIEPQFIGPNFSTVGGLSLKGPEVRQVAAFDYAIGKWYPRDLQEPATSAVPIVGTQQILYPIGRFFYVFSIQARTWSVLELKSDPGLDPDVLREMKAPRAGKMIIPEGDLIHLFDTTTGEWTHINTKDDK